LEEWLRSGEVALEQTRDLYQKVKNGADVDRLMRYVVEGAAALLAAHAFRAAAEAYLRGGPEAARAVLYAELDGVKKRLGKATRGKTFAEGVSRPLSYREDAAWGLAYAAAKELAQYSGATAAEKALAALQTLELGGAYAKAVAGALAVGELARLLNLKIGHVEKI
jgi:hypothetical protein